MQNSPNSSPADGRFQSEPYRIGPKFMLIALPLNLQGMDGAPARVIGIEN